MKFLNKIYILFVALLGFATGCTNETPVIEEGFPESCPLVVIADIAGNANVSLSRAAQGTDDQWSYTDFENDDVMGFFSSAGNWDVDYGEGGFDNMPLQYDAQQKQFHDLKNGVTFSPSQMSGSKIYMYYPYNEDIQDPGFELRTEKTLGDDTLRCVDFLSSYQIEVAGVVDGKKMALFGAFDHAFSELIIMRGEGFDNPPKGKERITAVLDNPVTHIRVTINTENGDWVVNPELVYVEDNTYGLSRDAAHRWDAWHAKNYGITVQDKEGRPAWYIIVPTIGSQVSKIRPGMRSLVEYIELYDNEGNLQQVTGLRLSGAMTKYVDAGWRYPMEISMKEMVPTVNPYPILPWDDDINLTDQRTRGINNMIEFEEWVRDYNAYREDPGSTEKNNALLKYGDLYIDGDGNKLWHFYLLTDLDMNEYQPLSSGEGSMPENSNVILPALCDILDGEGTVLVNGKHENHKIMNLSKTFVDNLEASGMITNIDFEEPDVQLNTPNPIGIIANSIKGAAVDNCNIYDGALLNPDGPAGFIAGTLDGGSITNNCILRGFMVSQSTGPGDFANVVGQEPTGEYKFEGNRVEIINPNN